MGKKSVITDEERKEFRAAMKQIRQQRKSTAATTITSPRSEPITYAHPSDEYYEPEHWHSGEDCIHFNRNGVQQRTLQRLKRGQLQIGVTLDLHQLTADEALNTVETCIRSAIRQHHRVICIVHGKGHFSRNKKPILKNVLNQWLRQHPKVLAFHSAQPKHGGTGAVYVLLKSR